MKKEIVDHVGCLLFGSESAGYGSAQLHLHSERQFRVGSDGRLEEAASVLTDITVDREVIYLHYLLPDGSVVRFANAVKQVDCTLNADYTVGRIVYEAEPLEAVQAGSGQVRLLFTLQCEDDALRFYEEQDGRSGRRVLFEIS